MTTSSDLHLAGQQLKRIVDGVRLDQLDAATPCADWSVTVLIHHLLDLTASFTAAAEKNNTATDAEPDLVAPLPAAWRRLLTDRVDALTTAWSAPDAWQGDTEVIGVTMTAEMTATVALDELVLHGWDLAQATGQPFEASTTAVQACIEFAASWSAPELASDREGLYGPIVEVPTAASDLDRLLGLAGRNPQWSRAEI